MFRIIPILLLILSFSCNRPPACDHANYIAKDSIIYIIDTVYVYHYIDTIIPRSQALGPVVQPVEKEEKLAFHEKFGIGPNVGVYYSPFNGFDILFGFGIQYNITQPSKFFHGKPRSHIGHKYK